MGTGLFGQAGGAESQTLTAGQIPAITSRNAAQAINVVTSQKVVNGPNQGSAAAGGTQVTASDSGSGGLLSLLASSGNNDINVTSNNTGGGAHNNVQPTIVCNYIIRNI
jgi:microcystin-dependent protein